MLVVQLCGQAGDRANPSGQIALDSSLESLQIVAVAASSRFLLRVDDSNKRQYSGSYSDEV